MADIKNMVGQFEGMQISKKEKDYTLMECKFFNKEIGKSLTFKAFSPWKKKDGSVKKGVSLDDLKINKWYKIGYTEYDNGPDKHPSKTAQSFFDSEEPTGTTQTEIQTAVKEEKVIDTTGFKDATEVSNTVSDRQLDEAWEFYNKYKKSKNQTNLNISEFGWVVIQLNNKDIAAKVKNYFKELNK